MTKRLNYDSREWFLETVTFDRLWRQWIKRPTDREVLLAIVESLERLGLYESKTLAGSLAMEQDPAARSSNRQVSKKSPAR